MKWCQVSVKSNKKYKKNIKKFINSKECSHNSWLWEGIKHFFLKTPYYEGQEIQIKYSIILIVSGRHQSSQAPLCHTLQWPLNHTLQWPPPPMAPSYTPSNGPLCHTLQWPLPSYPPMALLHTLLWPPPSGIIFNAYLACKDSQCNYQSEETSICTLGHFSEGLHFLESYSFINDLLYIQTILNQKCVTKLV